MPANPHIKPTQITRAGYEYQDLVGIEVLVRHYRDPGLYEWVELESSDPDVKALDDVVAKRKDGSVEFIQVKFTVDGDKYPLDWDWLLEKTENGTSMLAKWAVSFKKAAKAGRIRSAHLATNRIPSLAFAKSLSKERVDLRKVDAALRTKIETECGGAAEASAFFMEFAFKAGMPDLVGYEAAVQSLLVPSDTDIAGWLLLRESVRSWAIRRNSPPPDGKILRQHVLAIISRSRPKPLRQDFFVPAGYEPPSSAFDKDFRTRISDGSAPITILWGSPGRGKSTYLSFLANALQKGGAAVIRHHYFLSVEDANSNRLSFKDVATSLFDQLIQRHPEAAAGMEEDSETLNLQLGIAARNLTAKGKRLFIIVDGLDHVFRDTRRVDMLDHLFGALLPLPDNTTLIVGTQKVDEAQLPSKLLVLSNDADWIEIPPMDEIAVSRWIHRQDQARPFLLTWGDSQDRSEQLKTVAAQFFRSSQGHPLHLIYALEMLVRSGKAFDADDVAALPPCPDGDIRTYYKSLWLRLSSDAKNILHVLAGSGFFWPGVGIRLALGDFTEIAFLLEPHHSGLMPFHASIFAWMRDRDDHPDAYASLLPRVVAWLRTDAPPYWSWGWLWLAEAATGNAAPLLTGATRDWVIASLVQGWPERQIGNILTAAETITFDAGNLAETIRIRALKTRVSNAAEFQLHEFGMFRGSALAISDNTQQALNYLDNIEDLSDTDLIALAKYGPSAVRGELIEACFEEAVRRFNTWIELQHRRTDSFDTLLRHLLTLAARAAPDRVGRLVEYLKKLKSPDTFISEFVTEIAEAANLPALIECSKRLRGKKWVVERRTLHRAYLRTALFGGASLDPLLSIPTDETPPIVAAWRRHRDASDNRAFYIPDSPSSVPRERMSPTDIPDFKGFYRDHFWIVVATGLRAEGDFSAICPPLRRGDLGLVDIALSTIEDMAKAVVSRTSPWAFSTPYQASGHVAAIPFEGNNDTELALYRSFRDALTEIAIDLHLIGLADRTRPKIPETELAAARASHHWNDELWGDANAKTLLPLLDEGGASALLSSEIDKLAGTITDFSERGQKWTRYATLEHLYDVGDARATIERAADCAIGYGHHKDLGAMDMLDGITALHAHDASGTRTWIKQITPVIDEITNFTDGDDTDYVRSQLIETVGRIDKARLPLFYARHISVDEWRYADETLQAFLKVADLTTPQVAALAGTLLDYGSIHVLEMRAADGDGAAKVLLEKQIAFLGERPSEPRDRSTPESDLSKKAKRLASRNPTNFGPASFGKLSAHVTQWEFPYRQRRDFVLRWLGHWETEGRAAVALKSIEKFLSATDATFSMDEVLDEAFEVALRLHGKDGAFDWLVQAQIRRHGWQSYFTSEKEVVARLRRAAEIYPERWMEFITATSKPLGYWAQRGYGFSIGFKYLVRFLLMAGQLDRAREIVAELVSTFLEETRDQPIQEAKWLL